MIYQKELTVKYDVDVFVAGGGAAGVAAALAADREGKSVFLAESRGSFGGAVTTGLVPSFAPFYNGVDYVAAGIGLELRRRVARDIPDTAYWTPIRVEEVKRALDDMMAESSVTYSFFTTVVDVVTEGDRIDYLVLSGRSGLFAVRAKVYIDCTGDGVLLALGGGEYEIGDEKGRVMPATLCSLWANIDFAKRDCPDGARLEQAIADGVFTYADRHLPGMQTADREKGIGGGNVGHVFGVDPEDDRSMTEAMLWGRRSMAEYERYYKEYLKGFEDMTLVYTADMLGVRESRRAVCDYTLSLEDFLARRDFPDEIGRYFYPVDIHVMSDDKAEFERFQKEYNRDYRYREGESYGIPYRSLIPVSFSNLLVAGRCVGTDRAMQASVRVVPGCFVTGQAAGVAAALAVEQGGKVRAVSVMALQNRLTEKGVYLKGRCEEDMSLAVLEGALMLQADLETLAEIRAENAARISHMTEEEFVEDYLALLKEVHEFALENDMPILYVGDEDDEDDDGDGDDEDL